jgi:hypothetical protein
MKRTGLKNDALALMQDIDHTLRCGHKVQRSCWLGDDSEDEIANAIEIACETATTKRPEMINAVIASVVENAELLIRRERIRQVIEENGKLATEIINALARHCRYHRTEPGLPSLGFNRFCLSARRLQLSDLWTLQL